MKTIRTCGSLLGLLAAFLLAAGAARAETGWGVSPVFTLDTRSSTNVPSAPSAPTGLSASKGTFSNKVALTWNSVTNAAGYQVWRNTGYDSSAASAIASNLTATNYDDASALVGQLYYYWVKATNSSGASDFSAVDSGYVASAAPVGVSASDGLYGDKVRVVWIAVSSATGYEVWRHTANDTTAATRLSDSVNTTNYDDQSAVGGQTYYYWVKSKNSVGVSPFSLDDTGWRRSAGLTYYSDADMDGDGKMDLVLYDRATGTWYVKLSASGYALASAVLGGPGYTVVPGDYDGDGKTDPAVYEEATGTWTFMLSASGYATVSINFGGPGCMPVPGDYDGDGKTDPALYQQSSGNWYVKLSTCNYEIASANFGAPDYTPVQRDYDGDGKTDPALYQETTGNWYVMLSGMGYGIATANFGGSGYAPVPGDYDGDGKSDPAIYQESSGYWYVMLSGSGYGVARANFGGPGYRPVPGDFDGDGKTDPGVYREATGDWYVMLSGSGYGIATAQFGGPGYGPVWLNPTEFTSGFQLMDSADINAP